VGEVVTVRERLGKFAAAHAEVLIEA